MDQGSTQMLRDWLRDGFSNGLFEWPYGFGFSCRAAANEWKDGFWWNQEMLQMLEDWHWMVSVLDLDVLHEFS